MKSALKTALFVIASIACSLALADPPGRVGRISVAQGEVYFRNLASGESGPAELNWPITSQNTIATERGARAELRIGSGAVRVGPDSELEITTLDDTHVTLYLAHGSASVRVRDRDMAQDFELETPQGRVLMSEPSRIRVDAERAPRTTSVGVWSGVIRFEGSDSNLTVRAGKRAEFSEGDIRMSEWRANQISDDFDAWVMARDQRDDQAASTRYLSIETTGYEDLDEYGVWQESSEFGVLWYPRSVPTDWAPYRAGRWTWVEPWGWTWVDSAPWGYAPSHYGRWVLYRNRWCWAPGTVTHRPVWAPALVGWVGGNNWNVTFSSGSAPAVGWFPLAPRELYVPSYRVSPTYVRQINVSHVTNITNITNINGIANLPAQVNYRNRHEQNALTVIPQGQFTTGRVVIVKGTSPRLPQPNQLQAAPLSPLVPSAIARTHGVSVTPSVAAPAGTPWEQRRRGESGLPRTQTQQQIPQQAPTPAARSGSETPRATTVYGTVRPEERPAQKVITPENVRPVVPQASPQQAPPERRESGNFRANSTPRDGAEHRILPLQQPVQQPQQAPQQVQQQKAHQAPPAEAKVKPQEPKEEPKQTPPAEAGRGFMPYHPERGGR